MRKELLLLFLYLFLFSAANPIPTSTDCISAQKLTFELKTAGAGKTNGYNYDKTIQPAAAAAIRKLITDLVKEDRGRMFIYPVGKGLYFVLAEGQDSMAGFAGFLVKQEAKGKYRVVAQSAYTGFCFVINPYFFEAPDGLLVLVEREDECAGGYQACIIKGDELRDLGDFDVRHPEDKWVCPSEAEISAVKLCNGKWVVEFSQELIYNTEEKGHTILQNGKAPIQFIESAKGFEAVRGTYKKGRKYRQYGNVLLE